MVLGLKGNETNWLFPLEEKLEFGLDHVANVANDWIVTAAEKALGESTASQLPQKVNERAGPSLEMRRNDSEPELPVPIKKPEKRSTLKPRSRFSLNPFSLSKPRLEQQAAMLAHNPLRARQLIIDAGREPQLFGLA